MTYQLVKKHIHGRILLKSFFFFFIMEIKDSLFHIGGNIHQQGEMNYRFLFPFHLKQNAHVLKCKPFAEGEERKIKTGWDRAEESPYLAKPLCCDSIMEISSFPLRQRLLTSWLTVFTFRGDLSDFTKYTKKLHEYRRVFLISNLCTCCFNLEYTLYILRIRKEVFKDQ